MRWCRSITRASLTSAGGFTGCCNGTGGSNNYISANARYVAFANWASGIVPGDTNNKTDIFVRDRVNNTTVRVSVSSTGAQANFDCEYPSISADGRYVAFYSGASNLVPGDINFLDTFVHDRDADENGVFDEECPGCRSTTRVSLNSAGTPANGHSVAPFLSATGRYVSFRSQGANMWPAPVNTYFQYYLHDRQTGTTTLVSRAPTGQRGDFDSDYRAVSANGRYVLFASNANNLNANNVPGPDMFLFDAQSAAVTTVTVDPNGQAAAGHGPAFHAPAMSPDGRYAAFGSESSNLVSDDTNGFIDVFVRDRGPQTCPADVTGDGLVNVSDLLAVINGWGTCAAPCPPQCNADINNDCNVNVSDLLAVINAWGACP